MKHGLDYADSNRQWRGAYRRARLYSNVNR